MGSKAQGSHSKPVASYYHINLGPSVTNVTCHGIDGGGVRVWAGLHSVVRR
jgi:hypothetical protein